MLIPLNHLEMGTIFKFEGHTYQKGSGTWNTSGYKKEYKGPQRAEGDSHIELREANPKLGGSIQINIQTWFNATTEVEVDQS
jgi:hypothetical protein